MRREKRRRGEKGERRTEMKLGREEKEREGRGMGEEGEWRERGGADREEEGGRENRREGVRKRRRETEQTKKDKKIKRKSEGWTTEDRKPRSVPYCDPPSSSRPRPLQCRSTVKHWRMCEVVEARGFGWEGVGVRAYSNR